MKRELLFLAVLTTMTFNAQAGKTSCKMLMNGFEADGIKTEFDLKKKSKEKAAYEKCKKQMKLLPNSYVSFQDRTEQEAQKRNVAYNREERSKKEQAKDAKEQARMAKIREERELYTFDQGELTDMFFRPIYAYRFTSQDRFTDDLGERHFKLEKLTDLDTLCKIIGEEHDIKGMRGLSAKIELSQGQLERNKLNEAGFYIPDWKLFSPSTWDGFELFETSRKKRSKMRINGSNKLKILQYAEVTCVQSDNKEDDFSDIDAKILISPEKGDEIEKAAAREEIILEIREVKGMKEVSQRDQDTSGESRSYKELSADDILNYSIDEMSLIQSLDR